VTAPGMRPRQAAAAVAQALQAAGCPDAGYDARFLVQWVTGQDPRLGDEALNEEQAARLNALAARRAAREPLQYLCGRWPFLDFELAVGPGVLCPRADTEIVAEAAAGALNGLPEPQVLDLCAGTGCLGLGVKRLCPGARLTALEKSPEAFCYLQQNVQHALRNIPGMGQPPYARAVQGDLFAYYSTLPEGQLDLIVSNPPYLTAQEMTELQPEVAREPAMALAAGQDGLDFYRAIAAHYQKALRPGGVLALEIGWQQRQAVSELLARHGWADIECRQDYGGNDRCVLARRPL